MKRRKESSQGDEAELAARLKAESIQESLKAERIQEALASAPGVFFDESFLGRLRGSEGSPEPMDETLESLHNPGWADRLVFRETFLLHLAPRGAAGLRAVGRSMVEAVLALDFREGPEPGVAARVRALAEDLRVSAQALTWLESGQEAAGLTPEEAALAMKARSWAREVTELVQAMEAAVGGPGGSP